MENKEQRVWMIVTIITVSVLVLIFAGITYAFFTTSDNEGSTAEIISDSGKMLITYGDGTNTLVVAEDVSPNNQKIIADKTFSLTGTNTTDGLTMPFNISLEYQNTFINNELWYFIKRVDNSEKVVVNLNTGIEDGDSLITQEFLEQLKGMGINFPQEVVGYYAGTINNWYDNLSNQNIASGYFKSNSENETITFNLKMIFLESGSNQDDNKGATFNGKIVIKEYISTKEITDSWDDIAANARSGKTSNYNIGDTKEVEIDGTNYTVRVANNSTPSECNDADFSQTACGLVFEFVDIVEERKMNSSSTYVGGWPASELRTYANGDFFNKLPGDLKNVIIDTKVISGHGDDAIANFISTDKIYLLSAKEVMNSNSYDSAAINTRQLDYYFNKGTCDFFSANALKKFNDSDLDCWLRSISASNNYSYFLIIYNNSGFGCAGIYDSYGFAPAFRIG